MTEQTELTGAEPVVSDELAEVIQELEQYRERLLNETLTTAQRAKMSKTKAMAQLEPILAQIDAKLEELRSQQAMVSVQN
jgi:molybdenum cofactor biosynthesis enzyme MoaA